MQLFLTFWRFKTAWEALLLLGVGSSVWGQRAEHGGLSHAAMHGVAGGGTYTAPLPCGYTLNVRHIPGQDTLYPQEAAQKPLGLEFCSDSDRFLSFPHHIRHIDFFQVLYCRATDFLLTSIFVSVFLLELAPDAQGGELILRGESCWLSSQSKSQKLSVFWFKALQNCLWVIIWGRLCDCRTNNSCNSFVKGEESPLLMQFHHEYFSASYHNFRDQARSCW